MEKKYRADLACGCQTKDWCYGCGNCAMHCVCSQVKSADLIRDYQELVTGKNMDFRCKRCKTPLSVNGHLMSLACGCLKGDECLVDIIESDEKVEKRCKDCDTVLDDDGLCPALKLTRGETADVAAPEKHEYAKATEYRKEKIAKHQRKVDVEYTGIDVVLSVLFFVVGEAIIAKVEKDDISATHPFPIGWMDNLGRNGVEWRPHKKFDRIRADCEKFVESLQSDVSGAPLPRLERRDGYYLFVRHKGGGGEVWRERYLEEVEEMAGVKIPIYSPHSFTSSFTEISVRACESCGIVPEPQAYNVYRWTVTKV